MMNCVKAIILVVICLTYSNHSLAKSADNREVEAILIWNERILAVAEKEDGFLTLKGLRTAAMAHIAMHDTLAALSNHAMPIFIEAESSDTMLLVAITQAAFVIALDQYPAEEKVWNSIRSHFLDLFPDDAKKHRGIELGEHVAISVLKYRKADGWNTEADYQWHPMAPGVYAEFNEHSGTPEGFVFGAGWAKARPFLLSSSDQFRSPPPPEVTSQDYERAYEEVKSLGRYNSELRTKDQTHLALWWKDFVENSHNRLARKLVRERDPDVAHTARLFALLNIAIFDAYINVFDNKFHYNHWRPYTAIRWAENDGNPETKSESNWNNTHKHTYAFPSYPSAHGTACSAAMTVMAHSFGDGMDFSMVTEEVDKAGPFSGKLKMEPSTRTFSSFDEAAMECSLSRIYLGIHFRYDSLEGHRLGRELGKFILRQAAAKQKPSAN